MFAVDNFGNERTLEAAMLCAPVRAIQALKYLTDLDDNWYGCKAIERHPEVIPFLNVRYPTVLNTRYILRNPKDSLGSQISERQTKAYL